jgi:molybdate-binding protein
MARGLAVQAEKPRNTASISDFPGKTMKYIERSGRKSKVAASTL